MEPVTILQPGPQAPAFAGAVPSARKASHSCLFRLQKSPLNLPGLTWGQLPCKAPPHLLPALGRVRCPRSGPTATTLASATALGALSALRGCPGVPSLEAGLPEGAGSVSTVSAPPVPSTGPRSAQTLLCLVNELFTADKATGTFLRKRPTRCRARQTDRGRAEEGEREGGRESRELGMCARRGRGGRREAGNAV